MVLALAALIAAYHESGEPGALRATLPLAGRTLVERQARLAASAGANPIVIIVERVPPALGSALDRLRRDRLPVVVARSAEEAAEAVDPFDRLLLVADGAVADTEQLRSLANAEGETVLTVPDGSYGEIYERIDGTTRWAGLAAVSGALLRDTAGMLRDWDLQSTLLRRALQSGARHVPAEGPIAILDRHSDLAELERRILAGASPAGAGWAGRILAPLERAMTALAIASPAGPQLIGLAAAFLTGLAAAAFLYGWFWTGLFKLLLATPLEGAALRLAKLRMQDDVRHSWWAYLLPFFSGAALVAIAYALAGTHGWGMILLAFVTLTFLIALRMETEGRQIRFSLFLAERRGMAWLMLPFAIFGLWHAGLAALFAYAALSFFWAQRESHANPNDRSGLKAV
ncbi:MAG TPA: hypothetical protein VFO69_01630 [Allosphingosinicella sp.]|nr:hypothetical protein [Allosphingosinicella sp.]